MVGNEYAQYDFIIWSHCDSGERIQISLVAFVSVSVIVYVFVFVFVVVFVFVFVFYITI